MPPPPGALGSSSATSGPPFASLPHGKSQDAIFAGSRVETVAIELLVYFLESKDLRNTHLLLHSDNQGTIGALGKGRSGNIHINLSIRRTQLVLMDLSIMTQAIYVQSHANPADPISRGEPGTAGKQLFPTFKLPDELRPCFLDV